MSQNVEIMEKKVYITARRKVFIELTKSTRDWPSPDIQFTSVDDAGELEEHREPAFHPHTVLLRNVEIFPSMLAEHLLLHTYKKTVE